MLVGVSVCCMVRLLRVMSRLIDRLRIVGRDRVAGSGCSIMVLRACLCSGGLVGRLIRRARTMFVHVDRLILCLYLSLR